MTETQVSTPAAELFQKAHGKIVTLQRLDTQLAALLGQRRRVQDELNDVHGQIDGEFKRLMHESDVLPSRILQDIANPNAMNGEGA